MTALAKSFTYWMASLLMRLLHDGKICTGPLLWPGLESVRWRVGRVGAWVQFEHARRHVPAYRDFLRSVTAKCGRPAIPITDKMNYVKAFSLEKRCVDGRLPAEGIIIDESSGSSGRPTNWVRGEKERAMNRRTLRLGLRHRLGSEPLFILNAFALGPWATGINITMALTAYSRMKALGPDISKIENTLREFGMNHHYVVLGYPPFLKNLVDRANVDWRRYRVSMIYGGEGMPEAMRRHLQQKGIGRIYGSYGASDLELNIAAETDFTIALRRRMETLPGLAARLLRHHGALPMIFQYNPTDFFLEVNGAGELVVTVCRPGCVTPKIRYNIHDLGQVVRFPELIEILAAEGLGPDDLDSNALDLPLLFHYGRSDQSVAYYGCKIPPADIQDVLYRIPALAKSVDGFQLRTVESNEGDKQLVLALDVIDAEEIPEGPSYWTGPVLDMLASVNQDFRESRRMVPPGREPSLEFHAAGTGPFLGADSRIKRDYVCAAHPSPEPVIHKESLHSS